ncbi:hypothetical protein KQ247_14750 [Ruegeria pomeroyi]|uniref:Uncharacterized protein n=1 Tax=Ruegeria pomeroyi TaxID=89184 RepID=A0A850LGK2_9RHOB|nr:hypothetical protein [Ruegeria pomeroyi]NVK96722.1 hypothetical protein [Ruegeria pomeroyi]NVL00951.1 hypothetical protein [Ruegeria pomeroyi]QWV08077.1 hypothetical protein KQ247_14750 [Ruegeria pomeroyi]
MSDELLIYVIPTLLGLGAALLGRWMARKGGWRRVLSLAMIASGALAGLMLYADSLDDPWAAIGVAALAALGVGPVILGLVLGGFVGWVGWRRGG